VKKYKDTIYLSDQNTLVKTETFSYSTFPFEYFNPVQSRVIEFYKEPCNALIAANTSAGKTCVAEMFLSHEIKERGGKGLYLSPLRALAQEKVDDWSDKTHEFGKFKTAIITGDYRLTPERRKELNEADFILMTYEMLVSRTRHFKSENNEFLNKVGTLVIDESHFISENNRGPHLETGIMKFTAINPDCRIILLSATMPNVDEIAGWISHITNRQTYIIKSDYRPCPLKMNFVPYPDHGWKYDVKEKFKVETALKILKENPDDKFLMFVHTKRTGELLKKEIEKLNIETDFHNADLDKEKRIKVEKRFREDPKFRVIIATSTLSAGLNMPARRVIVVGVHCGLQEIKPSLALQMAGRSGRPKYDKQGDAYILLPKSKFHEQKVRVLTTETIDSQMVDPQNKDFKILAFHIVSEIHHKEIQDVEGIHNWYKRSLSHFQNQTLDEDLVDNMVYFLKTRGIVQENESGLLETTPLGTISSLFYYPPFDVADLKNNFNKLFEQKVEHDDYRIAMALGNVDLLRMDIVNSAEKEQLEQFKNKIKKIGDFTEGSIKNGYCYYCLINGASNPVLASKIRGLQFDYPRLNEVLTAINSMFKWDQHEYFKKLAMRVNYGVGFELLDFVSIAGVGKVKANKLWQAGLKTLQDIVDKPHRVKIALECSNEMLEKVLNDANGKLLGLKNV
jgi:helicase